MNTRTLQAAMKAGERVELWDETVPGLHAVVTAGGIATFAVRYRAPGGQRRLRLGRLGTLTVDQARKLARLRLAEVAAGADPAADRQRRRGAPTVAEACERYMAEHARPMLKATTIRNYQAQIDGDIGRRLGRVPIAELDRTAVERFHRKVGERAPGAANRMLALLSGVCSQAAAWGWRPAGSNPCHGIRRFREHRVERFLDGHERARLDAVLRGSEAAPRGHADHVGAGAINAIRLLAWTGARLSEITGLTWSMVDLERRWLHLPDSKTGRKSIPLSAPAAAYLAALAEGRDPGTPWVCASETGGPCHNVRRAWGSIRRRAELPDVRLHDLRHSAASDALAAGVPLAAIGGMLGHRHPATTARYAHLDDPLLRRAADAVGDAIETAKAAGSEVIPMPKSRLGRNTRPQPKRRR